MTGLKHLPLLGHDLNERPTCRQFPKFLQILVGESNTPVGPVACSVIGNGSVRAIRLSVDEDIPAGGSVQRRGSFQVRRAWVGNVQRLEVVAVLHTKIDYVAALGGAKIPLVFLSAGRTQAERMR